MVIPTLNQISGMPQMKAAFSGWTQKITLTRITQSIVDGLDTETSTTLTYQGTIQPLSVKQLMLKPEGLRAFKWLEIHCVNGGTKLDDGDFIIYNGERFKIMGVWDYSLNNYMQYNAVKDFQNG